MTNIKEFVIVDDNQIFGLTQDYLFENGVTLIKDSKREQF